MKKCILVCANCHRGIHAGHLLIPNDYKLLYNHEVANKLLEELDDLKTRKVHYCKNCGKEISNKATYCDECARIQSRKVDRPNREELKIMIRKIPFTRIGEKYNVTDNTIRKWCKAYNLPAKRSEIQIITDEEWEKI